MQSLFMSLILSVLQNLPAAAFVKRGSNNDKVKEHKHEISNNKLLQNTQFHIFRMSEDNENKRKHTI